MVLAELPVTTSDRALVLRAREGDQQAFAALMETHRAEIHRLILKFVWDEDDASDIEQDAWISAVEHLDQLDDAGRFLPWVKAIARNASRAFLSRDKKQRDRTVALDDCGTTGFADEGVPTPEVAALSHDRQRQVWEVLGTLSERDRRALFLREYQSRPYSEISDELGISRSAAEQCVFRARERFRQIFDEVEADSASCGMDPLRLSALVENEVDASALSAIRAHLDSCHRCEQRVETMRAGRALYRHLGVFAMPLGPMPGVLGGLGQLFSQLLGLLGLGGSGTAGAGTASTAGATVAVAGGAGAVATAGTVGSVGAAVSGIAATIMVVAATAGLAGGAITAPPSVDPTPVAAQATEVAGLLVAPASNAIVATVVPSPSSTAPATSPTVVLIAPAVHEPDRSVDGSGESGTGGSPDVVPVAAVPVVDVPPSEPVPSSGTTPPSTGTPPKAAPTPGRGEQASRKDEAPTASLTVAPAEVTEVASFIGGEVAGMVVPTTPVAAAPTASGAPSTSDASPGAGAPPPAAPGATAAEVQASMEAVLNGVLANADPEASREEIFTAMEDAVREYFTNGEGAGMIPPDQMPD